MVASVVIRCGYGGISNFSVYMGEFFGILEWPSVETKGENYYV